MGTGWKPVPKYRDQWPRPKTPGFSPGALETHWYWLERPTGTKEAATLTQAGSPFGTGWSFQPVPLSFFPILPKSSFVCFIYYYLFFYNC